MTTRPYSEMIKAWADNKNTVVLFRTRDEWYLCGDPTWREDIEYFICLEKHKNTTLAFLNREDIQIRSSDGHHWLDRDNSYPDWSWSGWYMNEDLQSRIKPKKETRWMYRYPDGSFSDHYNTLHKLRSNHNKPEGKLIKFEIEV